MTSGSNCSCDCSTKCKDECKDKCKLCSKSNLILDVTFKACAIEDNGLTGRWALDNFNACLKAWQLIDGSIYAELNIDGRWETFKGARSPVHGITQLADACGELIGFENFTFAPGTILTPPKSRCEFQGTFNFGGTKEDLLLPVGEQKGSTSFFGFILSFFNNTMPINSIFLFKYYFKKMLLWVDSESDETQADVVIDATGCPATSVTFIPPAEPIVAIKM